MDRRSDPDPPRDILAAEAFALGEGDPVLHRDPAHDVLAAEAFAMPAADKGRRRAPRDEHTDDPAPHDVLSAEEYAMPAAMHRAVPPGSTAGGGSAAAWRRVRWLGIGVALLALRALRRRG